MEIRKNQTAFIIFFGIIICALVIGYNAFYNPQAQEVEYIPVTSSESDEAEASSEHYNSSGQLNINTATAEELSALDGIGDSIAQKIIAYREENGDFSDISEIMNVKGIGKSKYEAIKDKIFV